MDKKCECRGISLLADMMDVYSLWVEIIPGYETLSLKLAEGIFGHLESVYSTPPYQELVEPYSTALSDMRKAINASKYGDEKPIRALEVIRDKIHQLDELKQLMVCGEPLNGGLSNSAKIISVALTLLAENTPEEAKEPLEKHLEALTCSTGVVS